MKLSNVLFYASLLMMFLTGLILFAGNPADPIWAQSIFAGFFSSVFCCVMGAVTEATGN